MVNSFGNVEVWIQIFGDDDIAYYYSEDTTSYVRAVRAFQINNFWLPMSTGYFQSPCGHRYGFYC